MTGTTYLDHGGTTIYAKSVVERIARDLNANVFGNPHSASPASNLSTLRIERVRARVLNFFCADPEKYDVVFVANATAAIKLVVDCLRDFKDVTSKLPSSGFTYYYHRDCHTSMVGVREVAGSAHCFVSNNAVESWLRGKPSPLSKKADINERDISLFGYPAQSNMNGHRLPLDWAGRIRRSSHAEHKNCYVLLDAAAYVSTAKLDLSNAENAPDFVALSFYKIFGLPDLGALLVRKESAHVLTKRKYFGGGTVDMVAVLDAQWHVGKDQELHEQFEDGTLPFHNIIALDSALDVHEELYGSMDRISAYTCRLAMNLFFGLVNLRHANGSSVCVIYTDRGSKYGDSKTQGPVVAFNIVDSHGRWVGKTDVERLSIAKGIQLRTGGVCNAGGIASSLELSSKDLKHSFAEGVRCGNAVDVVNGKPTGIVRASLGAMSTEEDIQTLIAFVKRNYAEGYAPTLTVSGVNLQLSFWWQMFGCWPQPRKSNDKVISKIPEKVESTEPSIVEVETKQRDNGMEVPVCPV